MHDSFVIPIRFWLVHHYFFSAVNANDTVRAHFQYRRNDKKDERIQPLLIIYLANLKKKRKRQAEYKLSQQKTTDTSTCSKWNYE